MLDVFLVPNKQHQGSTVMMGTAAVPIVTCFPDVAYLQHVSSKLARAFLQSLAHELDITIIEPSLLEPQWLGESMIFPTL